MILLFIALYDLSRVNASKRFKPEKACFLSIIYVDSR